MNYFRRWVQLDILTLLIIFYTSSPPPSTTPTFPFSSFQNADFKSNVDSKKKKKHSIIYQNHSPKSTPLDVSRENETVEEVSGPLCVDVLYTAPGMNGNAKAIYLWGCVDWRMNFNDGELEMLQIKLGGVYET